MTGMQRAERRGTTDATTGLRSLRRLLTRATDPADRASRRAGVEPFPVALVSPRVWVALG